MKNIINMKNIVKRDDYIKESNNSENIESKESNVVSFEVFEKKKMWIKDAIKNPGSLKKELDVKTGETITDKELEEELDKLKDKDKDEDKDGLQLNKKDKLKHKKLVLAKTLKNIKL